MTDIAGPVLTDQDLAVLDHPALGGIILFARNFESPQQIYRLIAQIHERRSPHLLVAVDQEGGRVQRFREGFTLLPAAAATRLAAMAKLPARSAVHTTSVG